MIRERQTQKRRKSYQNYVSVDFTGGSGLRADKSRLALLYICIISFPD